MYHYGYPMMYGGYGFFDPLMGLVFTILVVVAVFACIRIFFGGRRMHRWGMWQEHSAIAILNERFAKGEIDQKEYEERKKALLAEVK